MRRVPERTCQTGQTREIRRLLPRNPARKTPERIYELVRLIIGWTKHSKGHNYGFQVTITPLRAFFGHHQCFEMHTTTVGNGSTDEDAWDAFDAACSALADAFELVNALTDEKLGLRRG